jgi:hypothetical protein
LAKGRWNAFPGALAGGSRANREKAYPPHLPRGLRLTGDRRVRRARITASIDAVHAARHDLDEVEIPASLELSLNMGLNDPLAGD